MRPITGCIRSELKGRTNSKKSIRVTDVWTKSNLKIRCRRRRLYGKKTFFRYVVGRDPEGLSGRAGILDSNGERVKKSEVRYGFQGW